jgi:hypothetical protein
MAETKSWWLWSNYQNSGETDTVRTPNGGERNVVLSRNVLPAGTKVTKSQLEVDDAGWDALVEGGVVRNYPFPDDIPAGSTDSPVVHLQKKLAAAAQSEEERLVAEVQGVVTSEEGLTEAVAEVDGEEKKK